LRLKVSLYFVLAISLFLVLDSRAHFLFFKDEPSMASIAECRVSDEFKKLDSAIDSKNSESIAKSINIIIFNINVSYSFETKFQKFTVGIDQTKISLKAKKLDQVKIEFDKFSNMSNEDILKNLPRIRSAAKAAEDTLKGIC
jgi:hypothetical protein